MLKLRQFLLSDLDQILKIEEVSFPKRLAYPKLLFERYYRQYPEGMIVAESEGRIIGYTIGQLKRESAEIISLAVDPNWRGKGIGKKLTNFLLEHFKEKGTKKISLHVRTENEIAISFYKNLGFKILKTTKNYYQNGDDAFLMKKEIKKDD